MRLKPLWRLGLAFLTIPALTNCSTTGETATQGNLQACCAIFPQMDYSASKDSMTTIKEIRGFRAARSTLCDQTGIAHPPQ